MSKAEDLAEKLYPKKEHVAFGPLPCEEPSVFDDNKPYRIGFVKGYHQAEKDLELTYDDICEIMEIREDVLEMDSYENLYEEILKRFKDFKERKENGTK